MHWTSPAFGIMGDIVERGGLKNGKGHRGEKSLTLVNIRKVDISFKLNRKCEEKSEEASNVSVDPHNRNPGTRAENFSIGDFILI